MSQKAGSSIPLEATARWTASVRAMENARADRLLNDPWAAALAGEEGEAWIAGPGSWLGFDIINTTMLTHPLTRGWVEMQASSGAPWIGTLDAPAAWLSARGWKASLTQAGQPDANYGRWPYPVFPVDMPDMPHNWFVTAHKEV